MKTSLILSILGAAVMVAAQSIDMSQLPPCALPCALDGMEKTGCKSDIYCACTNKEFINSVSECLKTSCTDPADIQKTVSLAQSACGSDLPSSAVSSIQSSPTGNGTTGGGKGNGTSTTGSGSPDTTGSSASASASDSGAAAGLVPAGFAVAAIFAGLVAL